MDFLTFCNPTEKEPKQPTLFAHPDYPVPSCQKYTHLLSSKSEAKLWMLLSIFITSSIYSCLHVVERLLLHSLYCFMGHLKHCSKPLETGQWLDGLSLSCLGRWSLVGNRSSMLPFGVSWQDLPESCPHRSGAGPLAMCTNCCGFKIEYKSIVFWHTVPQTLLSKEYSIFCSRTVKLVKCWTGT